MTIKEILDPKAVKVDLEAMDKKGVLGELVDVLTEVHGTADKKTILRTLMDRENLGSTGIGQGIAIPHGKTESAKNLIAVFGISKKGVNFDALDGEPVYVFFLLLAPKEAAGPHLKALARISRLLRDSYFCKQLRAAKTAQQVHDMLLAEEEKLY
ncbi:MAG: PTS sugar transporter subunit IIA [Candidatus Omnitrophica bacterium]|nr:PTS sugar transporter subunit IIA [Candidatus Omnitrophota bacterium]